MQTSLHEAMEQQTVSIYNGYIAKAGIVCKLNTRCTISAAANPKTQKSKSADPIDIGVELPLLSRFDLIFVLHDERILERDNAIADHLLPHVTNRDY